MSNYIKIEIAKGESVLSGYAARKTYEIWQSKNVIAEETNREEQRCCNDFQDTTQPESGGQGGLSPSEVSDCVFNHRWRVGSDSLVSIKEPTQDSAPPLSPPTLSIMRLLRGPAAHNDTKEWLEIEYNGIAHRRFSLSANRALLIMHTLTFNLTLFELTTQTDVRQSVGGWWDFAVSLNFTQAVSEQLCFRRAPPDWTNNQSCSMRQWVIATQEWDISVTSCKQTRLLPRQLAASTLRFTLFSHPAGLGSSSISLKAQHRERLFYISMR